MLGCTEHIYFSTQDDGWETNYRHGLSLPSYHISKNDSPCTEPRHPHASKVASQLELAKDALKSYNTSRRNTLTQLSAKKCTPNIGLHDCLQQVSQESQLPERQGTVAAELKAMRKEFQRVDEWLIPYSFNYHLFTLIVVIKNHHYFKSTDHFHYFIKSFISSSFSKLFYPYSRVSLRTNEQKSPPTD